MRRNTFRLRKNGAYDVEEAALLASIRHLAAEFRALPYAPKAYADQLETVLQHARYGSFGLEKLRAYEAEYSARLATERAEHRRWAMSIQSKRTNRRNGSDRRAEAARWIETHPTYRWGVDDSTKRAFLELVLNRGVLLNAYPRGVGVYANGIYDDFLRERR